MEPKRPRRCSRRLREADVSLVYRDSRAERRSVFLDGRRFLQLLILVPPQGLGY